MSLVDSDERLIGLMAADMVGGVKRLQEAVGERPYGKTKLPERQQARESGLVWDAPPEAWRAMIEQKGAKATKEYAARIARVRKKFPDEAKYVPPNPLVGLNGV